MTSTTSAKSRDLFEIHLRVRGWVVSERDKNKYLNPNVPGCYWYIVSGAASLMSTDREVGELMVVELNSEEQA